MSGRAHARFGNDRGLARQRAELARDHRGDVARRNAFGQKRGRDLRQLGPGGAEVVHVVRLIDLVAERNRLAARSRNRSRADSAPTMLPASSTTPRWRTFSRFMRPMAR